MTECTYAHLTCPSGDDDEITYTEEPEMDFNSMERPTDPILASIYDKLVNFNYRLNNYSNILYEMNREVKRVIQRENDFAEMYFNIGKTQEE